MKLETGGDDGVWVIIQVYLGVFIWDDSTVDLYAASRAGII